jgi:PAS domain S-box-containing protein
MSRLRFLSSLRARLILLVLFALAPAIVILILNAAEHRAREADEARADVFTLSQLAARQQDQVLESARQVLVSLAAVTEVRGDDPSACTAKLAELSAEYEHYTGFAVARPNGDLFCRTTPLTSTVNVAESFPFQQALRTGTLAVGEYQVGRASGKPNLGLCYPVLNGATPQRVICGGIDLNWLNQVAADFQLPSGASLVVIDRNGTIVVRYPDPETWLGKNLPDESLIQAMLPGREEELALTGLDGIERLYAITPLRLNGDQATGVVLAVGVPVGLVYRQLNQQLLRDLSILGLVTVLTSILVWWGSTAFVLRQVRTLLGAAERLSRGDLSARTGQTETEGELNQLSRAFDAMAAALEQREHERWQAEKTLRVILQGVADGIVVLDRAGHLQYANAAAARLMGYDSAESLTQAPPAGIRQKFEIYDEAGQPLSTDQLPGRQVLQGASQAALTIRYWNKATGEEHWSMDKSTAVFDPGGQVLMAVNILHDVTELKRAELFQHLLAEAGRLLAAPLDWQTRLSNVAQLAVPLLADWCAVDVVEYDENIQRISVAHVDPAKIEFAYALQQHYPVDPRSPQGVPGVLRTGVSKFYPTISPTGLAATARDDQHLQLLKSLNLSSVMIVPLLAHGRTLGALTLVWAESGRHYTPADLEVAEEIGRRAGLAQHNARLYAETQALNEK